MPAAIGCFIVSSLCRTVVWAELAHAIPGSSYLFGLSMSAEADICRGAKTLG